MFARKCRTIVELISEQIRVASSAIFYCLPRLKAGTHYPYIRAVCTGRIYGCKKCARIYGLYIRAMLVPRYHCRAKNIKYDVKYDVI